MKNIKRELGSEKKKKEREKKLRKSVELSFVSAIIFRWRWTSVINVSCGKEKSENREATDNDSILQGPFWINNLLLAN